MRTMRKRKANFTPDSERSKTKRKSNSNLDERKKVNKLDNSKRRSASKKISYKEQSDDEVTDVSDIESSSDSECDFKTQSKQKKKNSKLCYFEDGSSESESHVESKQKRKNLKISKVFDSKPINNANDSKLLSRSWNNLSESSDSEIDSKSPVKKKTVLNCVNFINKNHIHSDDEIIAGGQSNPVKDNKNDTNVETCFSNNLNDSGVDVTNVKVVKSELVDDVTLNKCAENVSLKGSKLKAHKNLKSSKLSRNKNRNLRSRGVKSEILEGLSSDEYKKTVEIKAELVDNIAVNNYSENLNLDGSKYKVPKNSRSSRSSKSKRNSLKSGSTKSKVEEVTSKRKIMNDQSSDDDDWQDVDDIDAIDSYNPVIPKDGVDIMLALPKELQQKKGKLKKSNEELFRDYCKLLLHRMIKQNHFNLHKCHLLGYIAYSFHVTSITSSSLLKALTMSILTSKLEKINIKSLKIESLHEILKFYHQEFEINPNLIDKRLEDQFIDAFLIKECHARVFVFLVASFLWYLGLDCRIVFSYQPIPIKDFKIQPNPFKNSDTKVHNCKSSIQDYEKSKQSEKHDSKSKQKKSSKRVMKNIEPKIQLEEANVSNAKRKSSRKKRRKSMKEEASDVDENSSDDISDFKDLIPKRKLQKNAKPNNKENTKKSEVNEWLEVYVPSLKRWVCVDCVNSVIDQEDLMEKLCSGTMCYVLAFSKDQKLKDVTERYASGWQNLTPKIRTEWHCGPEWWKETLQPYLMKGNKIKQENQQLQEKAMNLPLPKSIAEYKHHKLYALARHLLKYEAIYPADAPTLGFIRGEPIYARECVRTLYSRDHWVQRARTVKMGETPYKIVKARPGFKKSDNDENRMLELFGLWQTEPYDPPAAVDGKVPRNAYGNVELFKPEMLPKGTKHLTEMPGLIRIARKLNIDCSQAMVGWDFRKGRNVPMLDGWVVCVEHVSILRDAWEEEQVNIRKREEEKREKRVYGNWRKLIKGLLIKKKIEVRYGVKE